MDNNEAAFPYKIDSEKAYEEVAYGMSLRDYFAVAAITGAAAMRDRVNDTELAMDAYAIADAMLKARGET